MREFLRKLGTGGTGTHNNTVSTLRFHIFPDITLEAFSVFSFGFIPRFLLLLARE